MHIFFRQWTSVPATVRASSLGRRTTLLRAHHIKYAGECLWVKLQDIWRLTEAAATCPIQVVMSYCGGCGGGGIATRVIYRDNNGVHDVNVEIRAATLHWQTHRQHQLELSKELLRGFLHRDPH
jgi:hypothetical protein